MAWPDILAHSNLAVHADNFSLLSAYADKSIPPRGIRPARSTADVGEKLEAHRYLSPTRDLVRVSLWLNVQGHFEPDPIKPPIAFLLAVIGPPIVFGILYALSRSMRNAVLELDLHLMTVIQAWRLVGVMFLVLYVYGLLPGTFAWPAGVGDALIGLYAPVVAAMMKRNAPGWPRHAIALNILGLLDFIGAVGSGVLSGGGPAGVLSGEVTSALMQQLPLALIPTFFVPFCIILHICSLIQLKRLPNAHSMTQASAS